MTIIELLIWLQLLRFASASTLNDFDSRHSYHSAPGSTWPKGIIPVIISSNFTRPERSSIMNAFTIFHRQTCIKFVIKKSRHHDYVHITKNEETQHFSAIGHIRGEQQLNLQDMFLEQNMVLHQLMHTIGFQDEHNRYDRDLYIAINYTNIEPKHLWRFEILPKEQTASYNLSYDYLSVMHFGAYYFAKDPNYPVLIPKQRMRFLGSSDGLSHKDVIKINKMYECSNTTISNNP